MLHKLTLLTLEKKGLKDIFEPSGTLRAAIAESIVYAKTTIGVIAVCSLIFFRAKQAHNAKSRAAVVRGLQKLLQTENITIPKGLTQRMLATFEKKTDNQQTPARVIKRGQPASITAILSIHMTNFTTPIKSSPVISKLCTDAKTNA